MGRQKHTAQEIVANLRQSDVLVSQSREVAGVIRSIEATAPHHFGTLAPAGTAVNVPDAPGLRIVGAEPGAKATITLKRRHTAMPTPAVPAEGL